LTYKHPDQIHCCNMYIYVFLDDYQIIHNCGSYMSRWHFYSIGMPLEIFQISILFYVNIWNKNDKGSLLYILHFPYFIRLLILLFSVDPNNISHTFWPAQTKGWWSANEGWRTGTHDGCKTEGYCKWNW
jgi:hypothetical protein